MKKAMVLILEKNMVSGIRISEEMEDMGSYKVSFLESIATFILDEVNSIPPFPI